MVDTCENVGYLIFLVLCAVFLTPSVLEIEIEVVGICLVGLHKSFHILISLGRGEIECALVNEIDYALTENTRGTCEICVDEGTVTSVLTRLSPNAVITENKLDTAGNSLRKLALIVLKRGEEAGRCKGESVEALAAESLNSEADSTGLVEE